MRLNVEQFEYIKASDTTALLRLSGRWSTGEPSECTLVASSGGTRLVLEPLPQPPTPGELWRAAYSAPLKRVESKRARFRLETPGRKPIALPRPTARGADTEAKPGVRERVRKSREAKVVAKLRTQLRETSERAEALSAERDRLQQSAEAQRQFAEEARAALAEVRAVAERAQLAERAEANQLEAAQVREREARAELERVRGELAEADARLRDVEDARAEARAAVELATALERNLAESRASEQTMRGELESERERSAALEGSLTRARSEAEGLRGRVRTLEDVLQRVRDHVTDSQAQLTAVDEFARTVRAAVEQTVYGGPDDAARARQRALAIVQLREELDARMARLQYLEEQAQGLRAAIMARIDGGRSMDKLFAREREPEKV